MIRTLICSLTAAGVGFLLGIAGVNLVAGPEPKGDTSFIILCVGGFFAGAGAIAGAIIGGVAELRDLSKNKNSASDDAQAQGK